ncbi:TetR/AcrR family transcriptional regulator [Nocardia sp. NPDC058379]|uniref:TetR/AcrR family transcriptional regulator n=1 Tax=unclassified Nocardia TaxID=2637762 RepID=UPI003660773B
MATKREQILDAAIDVLGTRGPRALTHRAADDAAGVPNGSASNYFRTREALLIGIAQRLEERDRADWTALNHLLGPATIEHLVEGLARFVLHATGPDRARTLARFALFGEAQTMPALHESLQRGHHRLRDWAIEMAAGVGIAPGDTTILVDYLDGVVVHRLGGAGTDTDPRTAIGRLVGALTVS